MVVSKEQARQFAYAIVFDIHDYIKNNQEAYKKFLEEEARKEAEQNANNRKLKEKPPVDCLEEKIQQ